LYRFVCVTAIQTGKTYSRLQWLCSHKIDSAHLKIPHAAPEPRTHLLCGSPSEISRPARLFHCLISIMHPRPPLPFISLLRVPHFTHLKRRDQRRKTSCELVTRRAPYYFPSPVILFHIYIYTTRDKLLSVLSSLEFFALCLFLTSYFLIWLMIILNTHAP
jgi:hypothetical protein